MTAASNTPGGSAARILASLTLPLTSTVSRTRTRPSMCCASASGGYFGFIFFTGLMSRNTDGSGCTSGFGSGTGSGGFSSSFGLGSGFGFGSSFGNTIFACTSLGSGFGTTIGTCLISRSSLGFCFFGGSGGGSSCGGCSRRTDITGSGGGSCQNRNADQFTPSSRKGRMISMPSAISSARHSGNLCSSASPGCAHNGPRVTTAAFIVSGRPPRSLLFGFRGNAHRRNARAADGVHHLQQRLQRHVLVTGQHDVHRLQFLHFDEPVLQLFLVDRLAVDDGLAGLGDAYGHRRRLGRLRGFRTRDLHRHAGAGNHAQRNHNEEHQQEHPDVDHRNHFDSRLGCLEVAGTGPRAHDALPRISATALLCASRTDMPWCVDPPP